MDILQTFELVDYVRSGISRMSELPGLPDRVCSIAVPHSLRFALGETGSSPFALKSIPLAALQEIPNTITPAQ